MFTGPGFHYRYGPQRMGNLGIRRERKGSVEYAVVLVQRSTEMWGMPGGYADIGETPQDAAFREGFEEAGIHRDLLGELVLHELLSPPKGFRRDTLHAWGEEWFTFVSSKNNPSFEGIELSVNDTEEVIDVTWMSIGDIERQSNFLGTHRRMIRNHESYLQALGNDA